jgi:PKD repeat protein
MAVSKNGFIISAINSNIIFSNTLGATSFTQELSDFFEFSGISSSVYDPRILYDVEMNRFIVLALHGNTPSTTKIVVAFSQKEDPSSGWFYYSFDGNPLSDTNWFDYPNVGLTKNSLFFSGLMRNSDGLWQYTILYQIDKMKCFMGQQSSWKYFTNLFNADNTPAFNIVPTHSSWNSLPENKMYFISNIAQGGNKYNVFQLEGDVQNSEQLTAIQVEGLQTALAPYGAQKNSNQILNTFDSRIWNAMELNGVIHFGGHVNSPQNRSAILYGRYDIAEKKVYATLYHHPDYDYGFPSISSFGETENSDKVLIHFLRSGNNIFAGQSSIICEGKKDSFTFSQETIIKEGTSAINALTDNLERWGDYSTVCRRYWTEHPEVWAVGCHGKTNSYGTWIAQNFVSQPNDYCDYHADKTTININQPINFTSSIPIGYKVKKWLFENGSPAESTDEKPKVLYKEFNDNDVTLVIENTSGNELTFVKDNYISVSKPIIAPVANFEADRTTISQGESVKFTDKSTNDPIDFTWTFINGNPASSKQKNPIVAYNKVGQHLVNLIAKNSAGSDNETKQKYITVIQASRPIASFIANKTNISVNEQISFTDLSTNIPTNWEWKFPGAIPTSSLEKSPSITYPSEGSFDVSLVVSNPAGTDSITLKDYIKVGMVSTDHLNWIENFKAFPNPITKNEVLTVEFYLKEKGEYEIFIMNANGQIIKNLLNQNIKFGKNILTFSTEYLQSGYYQVVFKNHNKVESIGFVVK